jgi:3-oxoacyl-[acyl-carrier protein] reductase
MNRLQNKVAIVTGAPTGTCASIAKHLAAEGAAVVVNCEEIWCIGIVNRPGA